MQTNSKTRELTDKIYHEGVEKENQEAAQVSARARQQNDDMITTAQVETQRIVSNAQRQATDLTKNTQSELKLYAERVVSSTQSTITNSLTDRIARDNVQATMTDADFMQKLMLTIVQQRMIGEPTVTETANTEALGKYMSGNAKALLNNGQVTARTGAAQGAGFSVASADGLYKVNFGEEEFVNFFKSFLRPRLVEELF